RIARQIKDVGEILPRIKRNCAQVQNRRNHHNSVQVHVVVALQVIGECRVAKRAIALANQEFRGIPPVVAADVSGDKLRQRFHIRVHAQKSLSCALPTAWLKPVPTGSINTRSDLSSRQSGLSMSFYGAGGVTPALMVTTRRGPIDPMCSQTEDEPGPPL